MLATVKLLTPTAAEAAEVPEGAEVAWKCPIRNCKSVIIQTEHLETDGEGLIPIRNAKLHRCKLHSKESLAELVKLLNDNQDKLNATDFKTLEQSCGFRFVPGARLCLETCWLLVLAVGLVYYDWLVVLGP